MPLSESSKAKLATCHPSLQHLVEAVAEIEPLQVICGHRGEAEQHEAYVSGHSKDPWPKSRHNSLPSEAVDIAPLPINWQDIHAFQALSTAMKAKANELGIAVEWGGDWERFKDLPHWQLKR